jgi:hypothetical protein
MLWKGTYQVFFELSNTHDDPMEASFQVFLLRNGSHNGTFTVPEMQLQKM